MAAEPTYKSFVSAAGAGSRARRATLKSAGETTRDERFNLNPDLEELRGGVRGPLRLYLVGRPDSIGIEPPPRVGPIQITVAGQTTAYKSDPAAPFCCQRAENN